MDEPTQYDLLVRGGALLTANPARPLIEDAAVAVSGDSFAFVGAVSELPERFAAKETILADGHILTPGFIDIHTHAILGVLRGASEDVAFAPAYAPDLPHGHEIGVEEACALARLGGLERMLFGTTLINDSYVHADHTLPAMAELGMRISSCGRIHDADFSQVADGVWTYSDAIGEETLGDCLALAERWHGAENGRLRVTLAAHAADTCSAKMLRKIAAARDAHGLRVNIHLAQSPEEVTWVTQRDGMSPVELLDDVGLLNDEMIGTHCMYVTESDIARMGRARMNMAHGPKVSAVGGKAAPTSAIRRAGVQVSVVTDAMHADMIEVMRWALGLGRLQEAAVTDFWQSEDVFQMATANPARALGLDDLGSVEVGKKADLTIIDLRRPHLTPCVNPVGSLVHVCQGRDVRHVVVDGRVVVRDGEATLVDGERIRREAEAAAWSLWNRAGGAYLERRRAMAS